MIELNVSQNKNQSSAGYGKWYPRVDYKETINIDKLAEHMAEHNTPFSKGTIAGVLRDAVGCIRELTLMGNTVKVDNLAIFKCSVEGNGQPSLYQSGADGYGALKAAIGLANKGTKQNPQYTGFAVKAVKLLAQATGEYTRDELKKDTVLGWSRAAQEKIAAAKTAAEGTSGGSTPPDDGPDNQPTDGD
jgi:hypothetical protein